MEPRLGLYTIVGIVRMANMRLAMRPDNSVSP